MISSIHLLPYFCGNMDENRVFQLYSIFPLPLTFDIIKLLGNLISLLSNLQYLTDLYLFLYTLLTVS
jgi:hypothetical protein